MCESETCPCRSSFTWNAEALGAFIDFWEFNFSVNDEAVIYSDPEIRAKLDELGWDATP